MTKKHTFHQFLDLPAEIRLSIWELTVRPHQSGAHFFSVTNTFIDGKSLKNLAVSDNDDEEPSGCLLAAPKTIQFNRPRHSWTHGNSSTYIYDAGLWTACWESRLVMQKHYIKLNPGYPVELSGFRHKNERWQFALFPHQDLVVLQPFRTRSVWKTAYPPDIPMALHRDGWDNQFKNIAVEYDPSWIDIDPSMTRRQLLEEDSTRGFFLRALHATTATWTPGKFGIWLVDYTLRRRRDLDASRYGKVQTFFGNDRKFVETNALSLDWTIYAQNTALHFMDIIHRRGFNFQWFRENLDYPVRHPMMMGHEPWYPRSMRHVVGLLCCETA